MLRITLWPRRPHFFLGSHQLRFFFYSACGVFQDHCTWILLGKGGLNTRIYTYHFRLVHRTPSKEDEQI